MFLKLSARIALYYQTKLSIKLFTNLVGSSYYLVTLGSNQERYRYKYK